MVSSNAHHSQFLGKIIQELRPALSNITGFAEILLSPAAGNMTETEIRIHHQTLLDSSRGISAFVSDVHDMVRIDQNRLHLQEHEVDAAELAEIAVKMCRDEAELADVVIVLSVFDGVELRCDAARIKQMLACLVTRAIRASASGGVVRVSFGQTAENDLLIAIANKGMALQQPEIALIFEPALHDHGLNGLTLPIARRIAMLHGGNVTIESDPDSGTTARLILPAGRVSWAAGEDIRTTRAA
jgi:two-component system cell cycle sensor histidine kinase PleC